MMKQYRARFLSSLFMCSMVFTHAAAARSLDSLSSVINERMLLMKDVAGYKAENHLPVEDLSRERSVLSEAQQEAKNLGLEPRAVEPFVRALIDAGKAVQYRYLADWLASPPDFNWRPADLTASRQRIQQLDRRLLAIIRQSLPAGRFSDTDMALLSAQINAPNLSEADKNNMITALSLI